MNVERKTTFIAREIVLFVREAVLVDTIRFRYGADLKCGSLRIGDFNYENFRND